MGFTGFYWVLLGFTGFYWVFVASTELWEGLTGFYLVSSPFTGFSVRGAHAQVRPGVASPTRRMALFICFPKLQSPPSPSSHDLFIHCARTAFRRWWPLIVLTSSITRSRATAANPFLSLIEFIAANQKGKKNSVKLGKKPRNGVKTHRPWWIPRKKKTRYNPVKWHQ